MDPSCSDLEFFDFKNATEEEIKEIQAILKGSGSNGCVELPWEIPIKENCIESLPEDEGVLEKIDPLESVKDDKEIGSVVGQALQFVGPPAPLSPPEAQLPPPPPPPTVEAYVTLPTTAGPYPNAPYFVSRTLPYLRAYPHMGVPFFACPIPGAGEPGPYGQFVPVVPATVGQEKFVGQIENENSQKNRGPVDRQYNRRNKKKLSSAEYCGSVEPEGVDAYREPEHGEMPIPTSPVNAERPTSVPLVPLPVPPSTFAVAGGTLPMHGYPPGLHTLPYTQMSGPQAPSPAMYYVPVFNHPYSSYIPSPPSAPMVLPVNLRPEAEVNELPVEKCSPKVCDADSEGVLQTPASSLVVSSPQDAPNVQSNCATASTMEQCGERVEVQPSPPVDAPAKNAATEREEVTDCNSSSDPPSSSPDCTREADDTCQTANEDRSRCWADLFRKPAPEVNGIDRRHDCTSTLKKDITNGKTYSVPVSDSIH